MTRILAPLALALVIIATVANASDLQFWYRDGCVWIGSPTLGSTNLCGVTGEAFEVHFTYPGAPGNFLQHNHHPAALNVGSTFAHYASGEGQAFYVAQWLAGTPDRAKWSLALRTHQQAVRPVLIAVPDDTGTGTAAIGIGPFGGPGFENWLPGEPLHVLTTRDGQGIRLERRDVGRYTFAIQGNGDLTLDVTGVGQIFTYSAATGRLRFNVPVDFQ